MIYLVILIIILVFGIVCFFINKKHKKYIKMPPLYDIKIPDTSNTIAILQSKTSNDIELKNSKSKHIDYISIDKYNTWQFIYHVFLKKYEYIMFLSSDMVIIDNKKDIHRLIQQAGDNDMILCRDENDHNNVNINAIIFRNSDWSLYKLTQLYNSKNSDIQKVLIDQIYIKKLPHTIKDVKSTLDKGYPYFLTSICIYNEHAFGSSSSSYIKNKPYFNNIDVYPWKDIPDFIEIDKNLENLPSVSQSNTNIPKYMFQTMETNLIPKYMYENCSKKWKDLNRDYTYFYFDALDRKKFIKKHFSSFIYDMYNNLIPGAYKADLWRYCILYKYGGCYMDIQMVPIIQLDDIIEKYKFVACVDKCDNLSLGICNGFICSTATNLCLEMSIYDTCLNIYFNKYGKTALDISGPQLLGRSISTVLNISSNNYRYKEGIYGDIKICNQSVPFFTNNNIPIIRIKYTGYNQKSFKYITGQVPYSKLWKDKNVYKYTLNLIDKTNNKSNKYKNIEEITLKNKIIVTGFTNPSIVKYNDNYFIMFRHFGKDKSTVFSGYLKDNKIFNIKQEEFDLPKLCNGYNGIEDSRVFIHDKIYALSTMRDNKCNFGIHMLDISNHTVKKIKPMFDYNNKWVKNWTPFIVENNVQLFCSSIDPLIITDIKEDKAVIKYISSNKELYDMGDKTPYFYRGSAGVIKTKIGYIGSCHYVLNPTNYKKRQYINILFIISDKPPYNIKKISKKFCFNKKNNINFLSGMETDSNDNIIFTVGIEDKDSLICTVDINTIIDLFEESIIQIKNPIDNSNMYWEDSNYTKNNFPGPDYEIGEKKEIFKLVLQNKQNYGVIDVGAHIGDLAIPLAQAVCNAGRSDIIVYAIDPSKDKCNFMNKLITYNKLTNIVVINTGLYRWFYMERKWF